MTLYRVTPTETVELSVPPQRESSHLEPGDRLAGHPGAPRRGEDGTAPADGDGPPIVLSEPISADRIDAHTPYVIQDGYGRVLNVQRAGKGGWEWAYFGAYDTYWSDVLPLYLSGNPLVAPASIVVEARNWPLHANGTATSWEYALWAPPGYGSGYPVMQLSAQNAQINPDGSQGYNLVWNNNGTRMSLGADSGSWNWAYVSRTSTAAVLTFHKFYVLRSKLLGLLRATWPQASYEFRTPDSHYEAITAAQAKSIYQNSGLADYRWRQNYFDCDDYSYVYKAQASKDAYSNTPEFGYAVGVVFATSSTPNSGHAANVFVDTSGVVQIIEPQRGEIVEGKNWKDPLGAAYSPRFMLM